MALLLKLITIFILQVGVYLAAFKFTVEKQYKRVGEDVLLSSSGDGSSNQCSNTTWFYKQQINHDVIKHTSFEENADQSSVGDSRLSVSSNCSLLIRNITDEDAGLYVTVMGVLMFLSVLTISSSPPDVNGRVDLTCSLKTYFEDNLYCENRFIWMDETGTEMSGTNPEIEGNKQTNCVSVLTVKHQSGNNKKITCQVLENDEVKIDAVYVFTE